MSQDEREKKRDKFYCAYVKEIILSNFLILGSSLEEHLVFTFMGKLQATIRQEDRQLTIFWAQNIVRIFTQLKTIWMVTFNPI